MTLFSGLGRPSREHRRFRDDKAVTRSRAAAYATRAFSDIRSFSARVVNSRTAPESRRKARR
jgi:hypothetical protein